MTTECVGGCSIKCEPLVSLFGCLVGLSYMTYQAAHQKLIIRRYSHQAKPVGFTTYISRAPATHTAGRDRFILYKGTNHGFAVRGNRLDPAVSAARDDALQRGLKFFNRTLCGLTASEDQEAVSPGVVLSSSA